MEWCFMFQWGGGFQMEGFIFKWGRGVPWWELVLIGGGSGFEGGGRVLKKIVGWEVFPYAPPTVGNPVKTEVFFQYRCNCVHQL